MNTSEEVQALAALLREGLDLFALRRQHLFEEERTWIERARFLLNEITPSFGGASWHYVGCDCGATVREFSDGARYGEDGVPHVCTVMEQRKRRATARAATINQAVEKMLMDAFHAARKNCGGRFPWQEL